MKTPKKYNDNLKQRIISKDMLLDCLYSTNKRAKNYRDKEREYRDYNRNARYFNRYYYDKYHNEDKMRAKKEEYYDQKDILLSVLDPVCVHIEQYGYEKRRIYEYEKDYKKYAKQFIWENCYYDRDVEGEVWFGDIELHDKPLYHYYLFYDIGGEHTFHSPIDNPDAYDLPKKHISQLETEGHDIADLISNQFVSKIIDLIKSKDFTLQLEDSK